MRISGEEVCEHRSNRKEEASWEYDAQDLQNDPLICPMVSQLSVYEDRVDNDYSKNEREVSEVHNFCFVSGDRWVADAFHDNEVSNTFHHLWKDVLAEVPLQLVHNVFGLQLFVLEMHQ